MELKHSHDHKNGVFYLEENGERMAEMTYVYSGETRFIIDHTEVFPAYEGKGLGKLLVKAAVEYARQHKFKILPLCPYAKSVFEKTPDYSDVLF